MPLKKVSKSLWKYNTDKLQVTLDMEIKLMAVNHIVLSCWSENGNCCLKLNSKNEKESSNFHRAAC